MREGAGPGKAQAASLNPGRTDRRKERSARLCNCNASSAVRRPALSSHASSLSPVKKDLVLGDRLAWIHRTGERSGPWTHAYDMGTAVPALVKGKLDHSSVLVFFSIVQVFTKVVSCQSARYKRHTALYYWHSTISREEEELCSFCIQR